MVNRFASPLPHRLSPFLTNEPAEFKPVLSKSHLHLRSRNCRREVGFDFLRHSADLPKVFDFSLQTIDSLGVPLLFININGISPTTFNSFGILPKKSLVEVFPAPNTSRCTSSPPRLRHFLYGILAQLSSWHQLKHAAPYSNLNRFTWHFVSWLRPSGTCQANQQCVRRRITYWYKDFRVVFPTMTDAFPLAWFIFVSLRLAYRPLENVRRNCTPATKIVLRIFNVRAKGMAIRNTTYKYWPRQWFLQWFIQSLFMPLEHPFSTAGRNSMAYLFNEWHTYCISWCSCDNKFPSLFFFFLLP